MQEERIFISGTALKEMGFEKNGFKWKMRQKEITYDGATWLLIDGDSAPRKIQYLDEI